MGSRSQGIDTKLRPDVDGKPFASSEPNELSLITPIDRCVTAIFFIPPNKVNQRVKLKPLLQLPRLYLE